MKHSIRIPKKINLSCVNIFVAFACVPLLAPVRSLAQQVSVPNELEAVKIVDEAESAFSSSSIPQDSKRAILLRGKKVTQVKMGEVPPPASNTHRQNFAKVPGLLTSEVSNESFTSFNYRGQGDPHESFNLLILQDGNPIAADLYGYPASYYNPPNEWVEEMDFVRGGAALVYGPQPGGALNYQLKRPKADQPFGLEVGFRGGSNEFKVLNGKTTFTVGKTDALGAYHRRMGDGFRSTNSDFDISAISLRSETRLSSREKLIVDVEHYEADHGEAGGLALQAGANRISFFDDRFGATLTADRLKIKRNAAVIGYQRVFDSGAIWESKFYGYLFDRDSFRQGLGSATQFGGIANGTTNTIQRQNFKTASLDSRYKTNFDGLGARNTLAVGTTLYSTDSPFLQETGATPTATLGELRRDIDRKTRVVSLFAENRMEWGSFSITPGVRVENIYQSIRENLNLGSTVPLRNVSEWDHVPLFGLGLGYGFADGSEWYANASQAFKPATFQDTIPLANGDLVSEDIKAARSIQVETGYRGQVDNWLQWDSSVFFIRYSNQFGRVGNVIQNTGGARYFGADGSVEGDLGHFARFLKKFHLYANFSALNAQFFEGPLDGKAPQYAPKYLIRSGVLAYPWKGTKISLLNTFVAEHFGDDGNSANFKIPSYRVWDLSFETDFSGSRYSLVGGIQNLFDSIYWSRVRSNGIDPALPRNFYLGLSARI